MCAWLRRCKSSVGELKGGSFVRLLEAYRWNLCYCMMRRCGGAVVRLVHLSRYTDASSQDLSEGWATTPMQEWLCNMRCRCCRWLAGEARRRCIEFWLKVMRMDDNRMTTDLWHERLEIFKAR